MRKLLLLGIILFLQGAAYAQIADSTEKRAKKERPLPPHKRSNIRLQRTQPAKVGYIRPRPGSALAPGSKASLIGSQVFGAAFIAGGAILFPTMHNQIKKAKEQRKLYGSVGGGLAEIGRGLGVMMANGAVAGGTIMLILSTKKLQKLKTSGITLHASPDNAGIVYSF